MKRDIRDQARAAVALMNTGHFSKQEEIDAFIAIFHPEKVAKKRRVLAKKVKRGDK